MALGKNILKLIISVIFDISDFFFRIPGLGSIWDIAGGALGLVLWGIPGGFQFLELIDVSEQIDGFIPTVTLAGLYVIFFKGD
jgi:hypothetical protein